MKQPTPSERRYYEDFRKRLVDLRHALGWSQTDMATALGMSYANYQKYEIRSKFPLHYIERLALVTHRDIEFIVTGRAAARSLPRRVA